MKSGSQSRKDRGIRPERLRAQALAQAELQGRSGKNQRCKSSVWPHFFSLLLRFSCGQIQSYVVAKLVLSISSQALMRGYTWLPVGAPPFEVCNDCKQNFLCFPLLFSVLPLL